MTTRGGIRSTRDEERTSDLYSSSSSASPSPSSTSATSGSTLAAASSSRRRRPRVVVAPTTASLALSRDDRLLQRALADAGRGAYGMGLVEVWVLDGTTATGIHLSRPPAGFWTDPILHSHLSGASKSSNPCPLCRLVDPSRHDYVAPRSLAPGEGLPGALWSQMSCSPAPSSGTTIGVPSTVTAPPPTHWTRSFRETLAHRILHLPPPPPPVTPTAAEVSDPTLYQMLSHYLNHPHQSMSGIAWEYLPQLHSDPDQPWNPRLPVLAGAGLGWVAGVPFSFSDTRATSSGAVHHRRGLVLYAARHTADKTRLRSPTHESYLVAATQVVVATYALRGPRHELALERNAVALDRAWRHVRRRILARHRAGLPLPRRGDDSVSASIPMAPSSDTTTPPDSTTYSSTTVTPTASSLTAFLRRVLGSRVTTALSKARGGGAPLPPSFTWGQSLLTFVGCFATLWIVTAASEALTQRWGPDHAIIVGPFGAFVTLLYGLTAAPASQPRNALMGQTVSMLVAMAVSRAAASGALLPVRQSFAGALAVAAMVKGGITHPPAGASALLMASGQYGWTNVAWTLVGNVLAIVAATLINNLSHQRQYPMYWWGLECAPPSLRRNSAQPSDSSPTTTTTHSARQRGSRRNRLYPREKWAYDEEFSV